MSVKPVMLPPERYPLDDAEINPRHAQIITKWLLNRSLWNVVRNWFVIRRHSADARAAVSAQAKAQYLSQYRGKHV